MSLLAFAIAAIVLAITPDPGIAYVVARTVAGGRPEGLASCFGTGIGGLLHVLARLLNRASGVTMLGLGAYLALARREACHFAEVTAGTAFKRLRAEAVPRQYCTIHPLADVFRKLTLPPQDKHCVTGPADRVPHSAE